MTETPTRSPEQEYYEEMSREVMLARMLGLPARIAPTLLVMIVGLWLFAWLYGMLHLVDGQGLKTGIFKAEQLTFYTGMKINPYIWEGNWWRLMSSTFVHMDLMHIGFNAYGLYSIGPLIEKFYGRTRFLVLYLGTGLFASLASLFFSANPSGGASGAIYGLVGAMLVFGYKYRGDLPERVSKSLTQGMLPWVIFGIGIGFVGGINMDNAAHVGGLVSGVLFASGMRARTNPGRRERWTDHTMKFVAGALVGLTALSFVGWGAEVARCTPTRGDYLTCYPEAALIVTDPAAARQLLLEQNP